MTNKEILNMKVKDLIYYCDNHNCSECPYQSICLYKSVDNREYTVISMLARNIERLDND